VIRISVFLKVFCVGVAVSIRHSIRSGGGVMRIAYFWRTVSFGHTCPIFRILRAYVLGKGKWVRATDIMSVERYRRVDFFFGMVLI